MRSVTVVRGHLDPLVISYFQQVFFEYLVKITLPLDEIELKMTGECAAQKLCLKANADSRVTTKD